jgi:hypothetical protein
MADSLRLHAQARTSAHADNTTRTATTGTNPRTPTARAANPNPTPILFTLSHLLLIAEGQARERVLYGNGMGLVSGLTECMATLEVVVKEMEVFLPRLSQLTERIQTEHGTNAGAMEVHSLLQPLQHLMKAWRDDITATMVHPYDKGVRHD